ncbi:hypothetical protein MKW92_051459 [Papaver armeniacum]|nr:hypothetical protein MKW92_051459 [Papaver armeniacum]
MPDAGEEMKPIEFGSRVGLVVLVTTIFLGFMRLLFSKVSHIRRQFEASRRRFQELSDIFTGLSQTPQQRQAAIDAAPAGEVRIQIEAACEVAADYDDLQPENNKPPMSSLYLWVIVVIVFVSAGLMIGLIIRDLLIKDSPGAPSPSGPP